MMSTVQWLFFIVIAASVVSAKPAEGSSESNEKESEEMRLKDNKYHPDRITSHNKYELDFGGDDRLVQKGIVGCFYGEFRCSTYEKFCVGAYLNEVNYQYHPTVSYLPVRCTHLSKMSYRMCGVFNDDGDWFDNYYESGLELYHNCSKDGRTLKSLRRLELLPKTGYGFKQYEHNYDLFNKGDPIFRSVYAIRHRDLKIGYCPATTISEGKLIRTTEEENDFYQNEYSTSESIQIVLFYPHNDQY